MSEKASATQGRHGVVVHLIDGTYELFRHFYGLRRFHKGEDKPYGAVVGVLNTVLQMIEIGATQPTTSSNRFATVFGPLTRRAREWSLLCSLNSIRWKRDSALWVSRSGQ